MLKKFIFSTLALTMILSTVLIAPPVIAVDNAQVCGMDGQNYGSADAAEAAGVDVSYGFACVNPTSESGLYESESDINFAGMLVEIGSTDVPTTIIVRPNAGGIDRTVGVTADTILGRSNDGYTKLENWIPGDQIRVIGKNNENTDVIKAVISVNHSIKYKHNRGINGWITAIDTEAKTITYQWANIEHTFKYNDDTRFVAAGKNPAEVSDLKVNDRIRGRLEIKDVSGESSGDTAKIVIVLRRGQALFMKIRTFRPNATLTRLDSTVAPTTIQVKIEKTPGLKANDVNNLMGAEGGLVTVNITEDTRIVRKYFGRTSLEECSVGDKLRIVGRVNDDGTVDAKLVKNNSIWKTSTRGHAGVVTGVDASNSYITVNWTPIKYLTNKKLKEKLIEKDNSVTAQTAGISNDGSDNTTTVKKNVIKRHILANRLRQRIKTVVAQKIGKFVRNVKHKKVKIKCIKHGKVKIKDLVVRKPIKKIKVNITENTIIVVGTNNNAIISDIQIGDKVRIRGTKHANLPIVTAETVVVVNSLPEIEESEDTFIDDVNAVVSEITTDDSTGAIVSNTATDTEEEITDDGASGDDPIVSAEQELCETAGGEWKEFSNGCVDNCDYVRNPTDITCTDAVTEGCDCGDDKCWNGSSCEDN